MFDAEGLHLEANQSRMSFRVEVVPDSEAEVVVERWRAVRLRAMQKSASGSGHCMRP